MTDEILAEGIALKAVINNYTTVVAELADGPNKTESLINFISPGNTTIPAGDEADFVAALRDDLIAEALSQLTARLTTLNAEFAALGEEEPAP